jgi:hypothetical protein
LKFANWEDCRSNDLYNDRTEKADVSLAAAMAVAAMLEEIGALELKK